MWDIVIEHFQRKFNRFDMEKSDKVNILHKFLIKGRMLGERSWTTKLSLLLIAAAMISGVATYAALSETSALSNNPKTVIWLLNVDLAILLALVALIARRILTILSGRRQNVAGSHLHVRLVAIFSVMAAVPAIIMAVFSAFFFHFGVQTWFSDNVKTAIYESQAVAEAYLEEHQQIIKADILAMANDIDRQAIMMMDSQEAYDKVLDTQSLFRNLSEAMIFNQSGKILARSGLTFTLTFEKVPNYLLKQAEDGEVVVLTNDQDDRVRALVKLDSGNNSYLFVGRRIDSAVLAHVSDTRDATARYTQLEEEHGALQVTVTMIFVVVALLLLMAAIWIGTVLARQLVDPISKIISASDRVRAGDLTARIPQQKQVEEFDYMAQSFNRMTEQLGQQRDELIMANRQLDQRRRLTETVLTGVSAGVVGVNEKNKITLANAMAGDMFECESQDLIHQDITEIVPDISGLLAQAHDKPNRIVVSELPYITKEGQKLSLIVRIAIELIGETESGAVLTFDDITELQSAQRKAAWADVARRVAHEIKNPLTPIQLSAERLKRKYLKQITEDSETFEVCTDTIIRHVEDIGRMVNEFSDFARMPVANMEPHRVVNEIQDILVFQRAAHPHIKFKTLGNLAQNRQFELSCDIQQIRQALTNLIQNAIDSINTKRVDGALNILLHQTDDDFIISVSDSGVGLPKGEDPSKLSDPYVTHREKGTGLGLAIVKKIMNDHNGKLIIGVTKDIKEIDSWQDLGGATISLIIPVDIRSADVQEPEDIELKKSA
jgi:two-component system nitrogen regulation sensor histidine kinase NtrY